MDDKITKKLDALCELEKSKCASIDAPASVFGELLSEIFSYGLDSDSGRIAREIGYHTGKFIYAADAADDYQKDLASGNYNPIVQIYSDGFGEAERQSVKTALLCELHSLGAAAELIDFSGYADLEGIIKNIIYLGMPEQMDLALCREKHKQHRKDAK